MVRFASVADFRVNASKVFNALHRGEKVVVTKAGKPIAVLQGISDEDLEDFILANHPAYRSRYKKGRRDHAAGRCRTLEEILGR